MKNSYVVVVVLVVVAVVLFLVFGRKGSAPAADVSPSPAPVAPQAEKLPASNATKNPTLPSVAVSIKNLAFNPSVLKIKTGTKVTWTNNDTVSHTVTFDSPSTVTSPTLAKGESFSYTFLNPGSVTYHCNIHTTMKGSVVVEN